jgi:hypothetical protein
MEAATSSENLVTVYENILRHTLKEHIVKYSSSLILSILNLTVLDN